MSHDLQDQTSLELAVRVAARLQDSPDLVAVAQDNLSRWSRLNANTPSLLRCYDEWREILARPVEEICRVLCAETDELFGSIRADVFSLRDPTDSDLIDGSIGEGSPFHQTFGYYAHGVGGILRALDSRRHVVALYTQMGQYVSAHHCPLTLISGNARIGTTDGTDYHG